MTPLLEAALHYASQRWPVFPCHTATEGTCSCGDTNCSSPGKHPRTTHGFKDGTTDESKIREWWTAWPDANIGAVTGEVSGLSVVDIDGDAGKDSFFKHLQGHIPRTLIHATPHGRHLIYTYQPQLKHGTALLPGIDIRNDGGYIVVPPSSIDGVPYQVFRDRPIVSLPVVPPALDGHKPKAAEGNISIAVGQERWVTEALNSGAPLHQRNDTAARLIGYFHHKGIPRDIIEAQMTDFAGRCDPPMDLSELRRTIESVTRYQQRAEDTQITQPPAFRLDGDDYLFDWQQHNIKIRLSDLHHTKDGVKARLEITTSRPGKNPNVHGPVNWILYSTGGRNSLLSYLKKRIEDLDWPSILEDTVRLASQTYEEGEPAVLLSEVRADDPRYAVYPLVHDGETTIWFGDGSSGKSYLALAVAMSMHTGDRIAPFDPLIMRRALYLDWETTPGTHRFRLQQLAQGAGIVDELPDIAYLRCYLPLHEHMRQIKAAISRYSIGHIVVDSAASACGGEPEKAEVALRFSNALRSLAKTNTVIAHSTKEDTRGKPFGSVFWHNHPRATFEIIPRQDPGEKQIDVGIYNRKTNNDALAKPIGLKLTFGGSYAKFERQDLHDVPELGSKAPVKDQLQALYRRGAFTVGETAQETGLRENTIVQTLTRHKGKSFTIIPGTSPAMWGNIAS